MIKIIHIHDNYFKLIIIIMSVDEQKSGADQKLIMLLGRRSYSKSEIILIYFIMQTLFQPVVQMN
jgi:hypothetical protein